VAKPHNFTASELQQLGFKIVFFPVSTLLATAKVMTACLRHLKEQGTTAKFEDLVSFKEFEQLIGVPKYRQLEQQFAVQKDNQMSE
jgi:methylisocitrate lyase